MESENAKLQEIGQLVINQVKNWKAKNRENNLVDEYDMAIKVISTGIIGNYLQKNHSSPYDTYDT